VFRLKRVEKSVTGLCLGLCLQSKRCF